MNILIVTAHPSSAGFTHKIASAYEAGAKKAGKTVEVLNLYSAEHTQDFLTFEYVSELKNEDPKRKVMQEKILSADEIVLIHPLWWFDAPAILKNWFDQNFTSGFAYRFRKGKLTPEKLLKGKTARVFITADGPSWFYFFVPTARINWKIGRLGFCGIKTKTFRIFASKRKKTEKELEKWLQYVFQLAQKGK